MKLLLKHFNYSRIITEGTLSGTMHALSTSRNRYSKYSELNTSMALKTIGKLIGTLGFKRNCYSLQYTYRLPQVLNHRYSRKASERTWYVARGLFEGKINTDTTHSHTHMLKPNVQCKHQRCISVSSHWSLLDGMLPTTVIHRITSLRRTLWSTLTE